MTEQADAYRTCTQCLETKLIFEFHRDKTLKDGHRYICKECAKENSRKSRQKRIDETSGLLDVFYGIIARCCRKSHKSYCRYGGRGIAVCNEWRDNPDAFFLWANNNGYLHGLQLDRINNDGNYSPENCRFVTPSTNQRNSSNAKLNNVAVKLIRKLIQQGVTQKRIASAYRISPSVICGIVNRKLWSDVT